MCCLDRRIRIYLHNFFSLADKSRLQNNKSHFSFILNITKWAMHIYYVWYLVEFIFYKSNSISKFNSCIEIYEFIRKRVHNQETLNQIKYTKTWIWIHKNYNKSKMFIIQTSLCEIYMVNTLMFNLGWMLSSLPTKDKYSKKNVFKTVVSFFCFFYFFVKSMM